MKVAVNKAYGGFGYKVPKKYEDMVRGFEDDRTNPTLIEFVETHPKQSGDIKVIEIPDTTTDYTIDEYDGYETLYYVVDSKIHSA